MLCESSLSSAARFMRLERARVEERARSCLLLFMILFSLGEGIEKKINFFNFRFLLDFFFLNRS